MSEWTSIALEDLADDITVGFVGSMTQEYVESGIPFLRSKNVEPYRINLDDLCYVSSEFHQKIKKSALSPGDVVIVRTGKPGAAAIIPESFPVANCSDLVIVRPSPKLDRNFLIYYLNSIAVRHINSRLVGAVQQHFNIGAARELKIHCPPIEEQQEIASVLTSLDRKIENLRKQNETLEAIAQTLFKHWFVDFEFPNEDCKPYKSSGGEMVRSESGEIPAGWRVGKFRDITAVINGRAYKQTEFRKEGTPIIRIQNLTGKGQTVYSDLKLDKNKYISKGDLIYAWSATFGPYIWRGAKSIYHYHIWKLNCFNPALKYYLYIHLKKVSDRVQGQGTGSIFTHITKELMETQELFIPDDKLMERWHDVAKSIFDKIMLNHEQIETLTKTRDVLLPKMMSGKLRITTS